MIVNNQIVIVFKVVVYPNITLVYTKNTETDKVCYCYISNNRNDQNTIVKIFNSKKSKDYIFIGYGCYDYDSKIITFIFNNRNREITNSELYYYTKISMPEDETKSSFFSIDLRRVAFSEKQRLSFEQISYMLGLSINNFYEREAIIEELISEKEINSVHEVLKQFEYKIKIRFELFNKYKVYAFNVDDTLLGIRFITNRYLNKTKEDFDKFISGRTRQSYFRLSQFIKHEELPQNLVLRDFILKLDEEVINSNESGKNGLNKEILLDNLKLNISAGGMRSVNNVESFICENNEIIIKYDFTSMFPTIMCNYSLFPRHLNEDFRTLYKSIRDERIKAKNEGNKEKSDFLKIVLNSAIGLMNSDWNYMYDSVMNYVIRLQSVYITLMLLDKVLPLSKRIIQVNIDGLYILTSKDQEKSLDIIIGDFQKKYNMIIETEYFTKMFQYSINDYLAIKDNGDEVSKGLFSYSEYAKSLRPKAVIDCIKENLLHNIPIKEYFNNVKNKTDFLLSTNISKNFIAKHGNCSISNEVRYYYSHGLDSYYIIRKNENNLSIVDKLSGVTIINDISDIKDNINYTPYYGLANKVIMQFKQKTLF